MGGNVKQCRQCGQLFQSLGSSVCPGCAEEMDRAFAIVKDYLYDHPEANVISIAKDTGVAEKTVLNFLREGRLSLNAADGMLECEACGMPISNGRFCSACQNSLEGMLMRTCKPGAEKPEAKQKLPAGRMHVSYRD